jgi:multidrug transporter EmrE-like cation transporter
MESKSVKVTKGAVLVASSTLVIAVAQVFLKQGSSLIDGTLKSILLNPWIIFGFSFYGLATILLVTALKYGNLSTLYPIIGLGYVWVCLFSFFLFKEVISWLDIAGISLIVFGVAMLGVSADG